MLHRMARTPVACAALLIAMLAAPSVAFGGIAWTGGVKGPSVIPYTDWKAVGTRQTIRMIPPTSVTIAGATWWYVAETRVPGQLNIVQIGYGYDRYRFNQMPKYFWFLSADENSYRAGPYYWGSPSYGEARTFQMAKEGNLWVGRIDGVQYVQVGTIDRITWTANEIQNHGEIMRADDRFPGSPSVPAAFTTHQFKSSDGLWHGGVCKQYHTGSEHGKNSIISADGQSSWNIWDSREQATGRADVIAAPAALDIPPVVRAETTSAPAPANNRDQHLGRSTEASTLGHDAAVDKVRAIMRPEFLSTADSIVVGKYRFTDDNLPDVVIRRNALVYIVSINGIAAPIPTMPGGKQYAAQQVNIVIDATTGDELLRYDSMITEVDALTDARRF